MHLFHQGMLIDIHPYTYPFFFTVCNDTQHVQFGNHLCGISVMRSTRHIPLPVEQHIRNMMGGTEINCGYGPFGGNSRFTHNLSGPDPVRIGYLTRRIQILDDIIVFQQFSRFIGCHDNFPWGGVISDNIHRTVHDRSQCILFSRRSYQFSKTPVIYIGISQSHPQPVGKFHSQSPFHRLFNIVNGKVLKRRLRPLLCPRHRTGGKCIFSQIPHHFMKNGLWMFRKKITESDAFIVRAHFNIQTIIGTIFFGKIHGCLIIRLTNRTAFSIQRMPRLVDSRLIDHTIHLQIIHPTFYLIYFTGKRQFPSTVIQLKTGTGASDNLSASILHLIYYFIYRRRNFLLPEHDFMNSLRGRQFQFFRMTCIKRSRTGQRICYEYYFFHNDYFLISSTDESENSLNEKKNKIYRIKQFTAETFSISPCGE